MRTLCLFFVFLLSSTHLHAQSVGCPDLFYTEVAAKPSTIQPFDLRIPGITGATYIPGYAELLVYQLRLVTGFFATVEKIRLSWPSLISEHMTYPSSSNMDGSEISRSIYGLSEVLKYFYRQLELINIKNKEMNIKSAIDLTSSLQAKIQHLLFSLQEINGLLDVAKHSEQNPLSNNYIAQARSIIYIVFVAYVDLRGDLAEQLGENVELLFQTAADNARIERVQNELTKRSKTFAQGYLTKDKPTFSQAIEQLDAVFGKYSLAQRVLPRELRNHKKLSESSYAFNQYYYSTGINFERAVDDYTKLREDLSKFTGQNVRVVMDMRRQEDGATYFAVATGVLHIEDQVPEAKDPYLMILAANGIVVRAVKISDILKIGLQNTIPTVHESLNNLPSNYSWVGRNVAVRRILLLRTTAGLHNRLKGNEGIEFKKHVQGTVLVQSSTEIIIREYETGQIIHIPIVISPNERLYINPWAPR